jgi:transmembrane sensor
MANVNGFTNKRKINEEAAKWILYVEDNPKLSAEKIEELNTWVSTSKVHKECLVEMAQSWGEMSLLAHVMAPSEVKNRTKVDFLNAWLLTPVIALLYLLQSVFSKLRDVGKPVIALPFISLVIGFSVYFIVDLGDKNIVKESEFITKVGEQTHYLLDDGSTIWLNSNTKINVNYSSKVRRINLIEGEAHFNVAKDPNRPFEVYANNRLVRAVGTSFSVYRLKDRIEVLVTEGKVELGLVEDMLVITPDDYDSLALEKVNKPETQGQIPALKNTQILGELVAGQSVSIPINKPLSTNNTLDIVQLNSSEVARKLSWRQGKLIFAGESLEEVITEITRHTPVKIELTDPSLRTIKIGGQFQAGETDALFFVLETGFGIDVDKVSENYVKLKLKKDVK